MEKQETKVLCKGFWADDATQNQIRLPLSVSPVVGHELVQVMVAMGPTGS